MAGASRHRRASSKAQDRKTGSTQGQGQLRIIAGRWRGRKLSVPDVDGLRPTGDRVRETLFNWLQADVADARCLDLFAGSGALGFEALSRYARSVIFVEPDTTAYRNLLTSAEQFEVSGRDAMGLASVDRSQMLDNATLGHPEAYFIKESAVDALAYWRANTIKPAFDLVFIDPPFELACQWQMLEALTTGFLADNALIYIEFPTVQLPPEALPTRCEVVRKKAFGDVSARLIRYSSAGNG